MTVKEKVKEMIDDMVMDIWSNPGKGDFSVSVGGTDLPSVLAYLYNDPPMYKEGMEVFAQIRVVKEGEVEIFYSEAFVEEVRARVIPKKNTLWN